MDWVRGETIGYGSFATVSVASVSERSSCSRFPPLMAVKSCVTECADTLKNEKKILDEIGYCPEIIQCFGDDCTTERGEKFYNLFLEFASRGTLADLVKKTGGGLPESDVKTYTRSVLNGLRFIHSKGFAHCDIKLQNILMCDNGEAKIADFGLATKNGVVNDKETDCSTDYEGRRRPQCRGTPLYMSPESINENLYEASGDIWALGCAVSEMASGKTVWPNKKGWNIGALLIKIGVSDELPGIPDDLSEEGKDFLLKCFNKDPSKRWTAEMLLTHPFVADHDDEATFYETVTLKENHEELLPNSPRSPFGFPTWVSTQSTKTVPDSDFWLSSKFDDESLECISSVTERIGQLICNDQEVPNWSVSGNWVTVR